MEKPTKEILTEELHKEIDLIQDCITRMANNSFLLKGWLVSIVAVILALSPDEFNKLIVFLTVTMVTMTFWYLDAYFLRTEKMYRKMYTWVLEKRCKGDREKQYDLNPHRFAGEVDGIRKVMVSNTLLPFYGLVIGIIIFTLIITYGGAVLDYICNYIN